MFSLKTITKDKLTHTCGSRQDSPCYLCTVKSLKPISIKIQVGTQSIESSLSSHQGKGLSTDTFHCSRNTPTIHAFSTQNSEL